jgi:hypothetical protein
MSRKVVKWLFPSAVRNISPSPFPDIPEDGLCENKSVCLFMRDLHSDPSLFPQFLRVTTHGQDVFHNELDVTAASGRFEEINQIGTDPVRMLTPL